jgi:hypothetical protein
LRILPWAIPTQPETARLSHFRFHPAAKTSSPSKPLRPSPVKGHLHLHLHLALLRRLTCRTLVRRPLAIVHCGYFTLSRHHFVSSPATVLSPPQPDTLQSDTPKESGKIRELRFDFRFDSWPFWTAVAISPGHSGHPRYVAVAVAIPTESWRLVKSWSHHSL